MASVKNITENIILFRFLSNKYLLKPGVPEDSKVEWGYCFDVHLNALFPLLVLLHGIMILLYHGNFYKKFQSLVIR